MDVIFPFCGDAVADCVVPLSLIPLAAAAAEATFAIIGSAPALLVLAAKEELFGSCETEDDPEYKITIDRSHKGDDKRYLVEC